MKTTFVAITTLLFACNLSFCQISRKVFEQAVDYANWKTIELSLKREPISLNKFLHKYPCEDSITSKKIIPFLSEIGGHDKTIALSIEIESVKNAYNQSWKSEETASYLSEGIYNNNIRLKVLYEFASKRMNDSDFKALKQKIKAKTESYFAKSTSQSSQKSNLTDSIMLCFDQRIYTLEQTLQKKNNEKKWFDGFTFQIDIFSIIISLLFSFLLIWFLLNRFLESNNISDVIREYVNRKLDESKNISSSEISKMRNQLNKLESEIQNIRTEYEEMKKNNTNKPNVIEWEIQNTQSHKSEKGLPVLQPITEILYLSTPNTDGSFNEISALPSYREGASIFKFILSSSNKATFEIDERNTSIKLALQYPDRNIYPVCNSQNSFNMDIKHIRTLKPGIAEKSGDKWIVTANNKALIKYE